MPDVWDDTDITDKENRFYLVSWIIINLFIIGLGIYACIS